MSNPQSADKDPRLSSWIARLKKLLPNLRTLGAELGYPIPPDLGLIYSRVAQYNAPDRCPVLVIPGLLGSVLTQVSTQKKVWGEFSSQALQPSTPEGARLFSLPMEIGVPLQGLVDDVIATDTLAHLGLDILGVPLHLSAYSWLMLSLGVGGFRDQQLAQAGVVDYGDQHFTCFQFAYDWRRDVVENAQKLYDFIHQRREYVREMNRVVFGVETEHIKFNLVAHSMGGLVARYFLRFGNADLPEDGSLPPVTWAGANLINKLILIGTPNAGALESLESLLGGSRFPPGFPKYEAALLGTMPAMYQLLPRTRHCRIRPKQRPNLVVDVFDLNVWERYHWGLLDPQQDRVLKWLLPNVMNPKDRYQIAKDHLRKVLTRTQQLHAALDQPADPPHLPIQLVAGDSVPTHAVSLVDELTGHVEPWQTAPGDGTVLRSSALLDERSDVSWTPRIQSPIAWSRVHFLFTNHLGLTKDPNFTDNLLFELLESPK